MFLDRHRISSAWCKRHPPPTLTPIHEALSCYSVSMACASSASADVASCCACVFRSSCAAKCHTATTRKTAITSAAIHRIAGEGKRGRAAPFPPGLVGACAPPIATVSTGASSVPFFGTGEGWSSSAADEECHAE